MEPQTKVIKNKSFLLCPDSESHLPDSYKIIRYGLLDTVTNLSSSDLLPVFNRELLNKDIEIDRVSRGKHLTSLFRIEIPNEELVSSYYKIRDRLNYPSLIIQKPKKTYLWYFFAHEYHFEDISFNVGSKIKDIPNIEFFAGGSVPFPFNGTFSLLNRDTLLESKYLGINGLAVYVERVDCCYKDIKEIIPDFKKVSSHTEYKRKKEFNRFRKEVFNHKRIPKRTVPFEGIGGLSEDLKFNFVVYSMFNSSYDRKKDDLGWEDFYTKLGWFWWESNWREKCKDEEQRDAVILGYWKYEIEKRKKRGYDTDLSYCPFMPKPYETAFRAYIENTQEYQEFQTDRYKQETSKSNLMDFSIKILDLLFIQSIAREQETISAGGKRKNTWASLLSHYTPSTYLKKIKNDYWRYVPTFLKILKIRRTKSYCNYSRGYYSKAFILNDFKEILIESIDSINLTLQDILKEERGRAVIYNGNHCCRKFYKKTGFNLIRKKNEYKIININILYKYNINTFLTYYSLRNLVYMWIQRGIENNFIQEIYDLRTQNWHPRGLDDRIRLKEDLKKEIESRIPWTIKGTFEEVFI